MTMRGHNNTTPSGVSDISVDKTQIQQGVTAWQTVAKVAEQLARACCSLLVVRGALKYRNNDGNCEHELNRRFRSLFARTDR
jgi:hypothetical protein